MNAPKSVSLMTLLSDDLAFAVLLSGIIPRITHRILDGQRDALILRVNASDIDVEFLTDFENIRRMLDAVPSEVRDVCEAVYAADIDECTVVDKALDRAANRLASFERGEDFLFLLSALSFEERTAGKNEALLVDINLDDLSLDRLADIDGEILDEVEFHLGCRDEAAQTLDGGNEAALDNLRDVSLNRLASFLFFFSISVQATMRSAFTLERMPPLSPPRETT